LPGLISEERKDEKPVQSAVEMLTNGEFKIVRSTLPDFDPAKDAEEPEAEEPEETPDEEKAE
ncbi:MAG: hypothetical protein IKR53_02995, partial [Clostridia bacterium]|nr:hypothetical protein [Clostridia bacterium]